MEDTFYFGYVGTKFQLADLVTKVLLGIRSAYLMKFTMVNVKEEDSSAQEG